MSDEQQSEVTNPAILMHLSVLKSAIVRTSGLEITASTKEAFYTTQNRKLEAEHIIVPAEKVELETQYTLWTLEIRKLLLKMQFGNPETNWGKGSRHRGRCCKKGGVYLLIEGSRRRFCCIQSGKICHYGCCRMSYPRKILIPSYSSTNLTKIFLSWGRIPVFTKMEELGFVTNEELAQFLGISTYLFLNVSRRRR